MPCTARLTSSRASSRLCLWRPISAFVEVPGSIVFAFDDGTFAAVKQLPAAAEVPVMHFTQHSDHISIPQVLLDEVYAAVLDAAQLQSWSIEALGARLQALLPSWDLTLHNTRAPSAQRKPLTPLILPNQYLTASRPAGVVAKGKVHDPIDLVIDFNFRRHFELPGLASQCYLAAMEELPHIFVGHRSQLETLIADVSHLMLREYRAKGMSMPPWRTTQALLSLWSNGHTQPAVSVGAAVAAPTTPFARAISEDLEFSPRTGFSAAPTLRTRNSSMPAKVMLGFDVNPSSSPDMVLDSPVSGLVFRPSLDSSRASSDAGESATLQLFGARDSVGSPQGLDGSSGFASLVGSSGAASLLGSSPETEDKADMMLRLARAALTPVAGKPWLA